MAASAAVSQESGNLEEQEIDEGAALEEFLAWLVANGAHWTVIKITDLMH